MTVGAKTVRSTLIERLKQDLLGPLTSDEVLEARPFDVYLTGILWPLESSIEADEDDGEVDEDGGDSTSGHTSVFGQMKPSTMGISFALPFSECPEIFVNYEFSNYVEFEDENKRELWARKNNQEILKVDVNFIGNRYIPIENCSENLKVMLHIRVKKFLGTRIVTVTLVNASKLETGAKVEANGKSLFQTFLRISLPSDLNFLGLPDDRLPIDEDEESAQLLYSKQLSYAVGHQCSATWDYEKFTVSTVETSWLPVEYVPMYSQKGHDYFRNLVDSKSLQAEFLSNSPKIDVLTVLNDLCIAYEKWINLNRSYLPALDSNLINTANRHLIQCEETLARMRNGVNLLSQNNKAFEAFKIANKAMALQHSWKFDKEDSRRVLEWRPFQMAFMLITLVSICDPRSVERDILDLLWFPTGGGKTEAYLAIIAFGVSFQRLSSDLVSDDFGNYAIMRYTLRLLTAQQFERASSLILALESIRLKQTKLYYEGNLREVPFSIGLWVGQDATPNTFSDAKSNRGSNFRASAEQLRNCFACESNLKWKYDEQKFTVRPSCENSMCELGPNFGIWPVATVDEDIYKLRPTLLIGTVDKFAQLPRKPEMKRLFGFKTNSATQLIIQDELHLISGPLGTIVGAYEVAIDWLLTNEGKKPKVIGSTATIRRAQSQVKALFNRESAQFPPPGLSFEDSGFAVIDEEKPGRVYIGLSNAGRSAKFTFQAVAGSLLQSGGLEEIGDVVSRDGYSTLLMYFNNLRELGGAIVQVLDDVPDSILLYANRRAESIRQIELPKELTSTRTQIEIVEILEDLSERCDSPNSVDVVLATNMVSVGVDVPRLGLMQVNGQPKTRSEYIQATSRVGRSESPGLVIVAHNVLRARDRSHFETFATWHRRLYRDVEATSVTPFASRSRDRTLKTILASMLRHGDSNMLDSPNLHNANIEILKSIVHEIENRAKNIDSSVAEDVAIEIRNSLDEWSSREVNEYFDESVVGSRKSLLQSAERYAQKVAAGILPGYAWPVMNAMRSVEASTNFRLKEKAYKKKEAAEDKSDDSLPPWRQF